MSVGLQSCS